MSDGSFAVASQQCVLSIRTGTIMTHVQACVLEELVCNSHSGFWFWCFFLLFFVVYRFPIDKTLDDNDTI